MFKVKVAVWENTMTVEEYQQSESLLIDLAGNCQSPLLLGRSRQQRGCCVRNGGHRQ